MRKWIALLLLATTPALAHSWYPSDCCSDKDCEIIHEDHVQLGATGYILPSGEIVSYGEERTSPDGQYHWCHNPRLITAGGKRCFWAPKGGV